MRVEAGQPVEVTIPCPAGPPDPLGAQIEEPVTRNVVVPWTQCVLWDERLTDDNGEWFTQWWVTVTLDAPPPGDWLIVWKGAQESRVVGYVPLWVAEPVTAA